jgi:putative FmdB family regulatory protein
MPIYAYECDQCGHVQDLTRPYDRRKDDHPCERCDGESKYQFPFAAALGYQPFEAYWDEVLDCDVNGRREKKEILKAEGLIEAGDKSGGSRLFDSNLPDHIKPRPPKGISYAQMAHERSEKKRTSPKPDIKGIDSDGKEYAAVPMRRE